MENLFVNQTEIFETLKKLLTNIKKDGAERKTRDYCKRKLELLESYWSEYHQNHTKMCEIAEFDHVYFKKRCFDTAEELYLTIKELINKTLEQLLPQQPRRSEAQVQQGVTPRKAEAEAVYGPGPSTGTDSLAISSQCQPQQVIMSNSSTKLGDMIKKQTINFKAFMRTVSSIDVESIKNRWEFEDALKSLQTRWSIIDQLHWEIEGESDGDDDHYQEQFTRYEKIFTELKKTINTKMWSVSHREKSTPQMDIPVFSGNYHHWVPFKDLFDEAIHKNPSLSNAQKMQFLKSKVSGEAERLIHHLQISSDNYEVCWELLNHRYGNKRLIFTSYLNTLLGLPNIQQQSLNMIKKLHDVTKECLHAIQNLGVDITTWDPLLVHLLGQKLDSESFSEYVESVKKPRELPVLQEFLDYLESKFTTLEASKRKQEPNLAKGTTHNHNQNQLMHQSFPYNQRSNYNPNTNYNSQKTNINNVRTMKTFHVARSITCALCNADHGLWQCSKFLQMTNEQKLKSIDQLKCCHNCLINHLNKPCFSTKRCRKCLGKHNSLLHDAMTMTNKQFNIPAKPYSNPKPDSINPVNKDRVTSSSHVTWDDMSEILLATALVKITGSDGTQHTMRALIDQGSQISLINEHSAQVLGLKRKHCKGKIYGVGEKENNCKGMITVTIQSTCNDFYIDTNVIIMNNLIKSLPNKTFIKPSWSHIKNINLADPQFNISRPVDLLLGADVYSKIMLGGILRGDNEDQPIAQQTQLGWLLCGSMQPVYHCNVILHNTEDLSRFWETEDINQQVEMSVEDHECLQHFLSTTKRLEDGTYEVRLPFNKELKEKLGSTKDKALAQFRNLEKKLEKSENQKIDYHAFINEYYTMNHMIPSTNMTTESYLPHHAVTREDSTTTKLRVVFNASAKSSTGYSLNDVLYRGPNLQQDIQELIIKWRQYQFVFSADIEKMYRIIRVHSEDQIYQKILWRNSLNQPILPYQLTTVTYGTKPAPFLAMMCLKQLATDEKENFPNAALALENNFYMDDFCGGQHNIESALKLRDELIKLLQSAGFNLRKWTANEPQLLEDLDICLRNQKTYEFKEISSSKTLGLSWDPLKDEFTFQSKINPTSPSVPTKRSLLSDISKLFDPLGWLTPLSTKLKILFQKVWLCELKWDDPLPEEINNEWSKLKIDLAEINTIKLSRWLGIKENQSVQLHGFCDASKKAYAAVIYCKIINNDDVTITLVAAKSRLVPVSKEITIPRLELMGAKLLTELMTKIKNCLPNYTIHICAWTDSTAVLGWLQGETTRWNTFVANRVKEINLSLPSNQWRYVKTCENPADCATRGLTTNQLKNHELWWQGPSWLPSFTTTNEPETIVYETDLETKKSFIKQVNAVTMKDNTMLNIIIYLLSTYSSLNKIIRYFAWILRLPTYKKVIHQPYLTLHELSNAKLLIIKNIQQLEFTDDIQHLQKHGKVHNKSKILNLNPILDQDGLLRVGGRLRNADIDWNMKYPIILPSNHRLTTLLIQQAHELTFHGGARLTLANLRQKYWLINGYMTVKKFIRQCVICRKQNPIKQYQLMGDLPASRVNPEQAFYHCGVDYTGFVEVKANKGRGIKTTKGYIALFICMATKAVHIELVSDLSSSAFLAALTRMSARRGAPRHIYSDNGTNFVGANRVLQEEQHYLQEIFNDSFLSEVNELGIEWHFNAPSWPNAGGLWERAVRSLKHHLKRVVGTQKLTFEEYTTLLSKIEACLNSRPLCSMSEDPEDLNILTPAHFLTARPGSTIIETEKDARTRWHLVKKLFQDVWNKWKSEYLTQLSSRNKWTVTQKNITINDLVVIQDDNLPPGKWAMGRVTELHPGEDGLVRVVTLKTKNGYMKRPIVKLSILPVYHNNQPEIPPTDLPTQPIQEENSIPEKRKGFTKKSFTSIATALIFFMSLLSPASGVESIQNLPTNQTLYFDSVSKMQIIRDKWTLVVYYDLQPYWTGLETFTKITSYLETLCITIDKQSHCNLILSQLQHEFQEINYYNELLLTQHFNVHARRRRRRRGLINGVGVLANDLFGVLDSRFAEKYSQDIATIQKNENHIVELYKNQTSVIEAEFNLMKRMEATVDKQHKIINKKINELQTATNFIQKEILNISYVQEFTLSAMAGNSLLQNIKRLQDTMLDTITDIYHGQISLHLLTPDRIKKELQVIYAQMPRELTLPIDNIDTGLQYIYKLLKVKARVTYNYLIVEINFPLIDRENYQLYKIIPIPHQIENNMVTLLPISDYVAVNFRKDAFITITLPELNACLHNGVAYMCHMPKPILSLKNDESFCQKTMDNQQCEVTNSPCQNRWTELHSSQQYLYFCCDISTIKIICNDQVTVRHLIGAGFIGTSSNCIIKGKDFTLHFSNSMTNQINYTPHIMIPEIDQINHLVNLPIPIDNSTEPSLSNLNASLANLEKQVNDLKNNKVAIDDISSHDVHQYSIMYVLVAAALVVGILWIWKKRQCCLLSTSSPRSRGGLPREEPGQELQTVIPSPRPRQTTTAAEPVYSVVQSRKQSTADRQLSVSELGQGRSSVRLHTLANRWPSVKRVINKDKKPNVSTVEDSLV